LLSMLPHPAAMGLLARAKSCPPCGIRASGGALSSRESTTRKERSCEFSLRERPGLGRHLVPGLVAAGHEVTATTRTPGKVARLREVGAEPVVVDGLDREAVIAAVRAARPEVIVHQMTALADVRSRSLRNPDKMGAATIELRTQGTDNLLAAAARAGTSAFAVSISGPVLGQRAANSSRTLSQAASA
jgi:UDP-glucose 4-epimerase